MALDLQGLTAYTDEHKMELIRKSVTEGKSLNYFTIQPDIKHSATINILDSDLVVQAGSCGWDEDGTTKLIQREIEVAPLKVNESICLDDLEKYYTGKMMNPGSYNEEIPFEGIYADDKANKIAEIIELMIWKGDTTNGTGNLALVDGLIVLLDADNTVVDGNVGSETAITASNIIDIVDGMNASIPEDIAEADDLVLFMSVANYKTWTKALRDANLYHYEGAEGNFEMYAPGTNMKVVATKGLSGTDRMFASRAANFYFGTDLLNDAEDFKIFYSEDNDEVRFRSKFKVGVQVAFPSLVVSYEND